MTINLEKHSIKNCRKRKGFRGWLIEIKKERMRRKLRKRNN